MPGPELTPTAAVEALFEDFCEETCRDAAEALHEWIATLEGSVSFERFLAEPMVDELFASGDPDLELWGDVVSALLGRAKDLGGKDGSRLVGWASWCRGEDVLTLVWPDTPESALRPRPAARRAFAHATRDLVAWLEDASAPLRSAAAHALAWSTEDAAVTDRLRRAAETENDPTALASMRLALGVLGPSSAADDTRATEALTTLCGWVTAQAEVLDEQDGVALARIASSTTPLPAEWGWRSRGRTPLPEGALALALMCRVRFAAPEAVMKTLEGLALERDALGLGELGASALVHVGFEGRGVRGDRMGLTVSNLDPVARAALCRIAGKDVRAEVALRRIGLPSVPQGNVVAAFLEAQDIDWRPFEWPSPDGLQRWHFGRLWGEVMAGKAEPAAVADTVTNAASPDEAATLVTRFGVSRTPAWDILGDSPALWERDQALALAVLERVAARVDWDALIRAVTCNRKSGLPGVTAVGYLRYAPSPNLAKHPEFFARARAEARVEEPLASLIRASK